MTRLRPLCFFAFLFALAPALPAQKPADLKKSGERYFANRRWADALDALNQYQQLKPGDPAVLTKLGIVHYELHHADQALQFLEYVTKQSAANPDPEALYYLARTLHGRQDFERAAATYKAFLRAAGERHPLRGNAADNLLRCTLAPGIAPNETVALVENLGNRVNSAGDEFAPLTVPRRPNQLAFAAARAGTTGGRRNEEGLEDEHAGRWCADMFYAQLGAAGWDGGGDPGSLLNTPRNETPLGFSDDGQLFYYFRGFTLFSGEALLDSTAVHDEYSTEARPFVSPFQPEAGDTAPFFFNDSTLLFASRRAGGSGGLDLWYALRRNGSWQPSQNFGPAVNSPYDETTPFLARDGYTLYFSANHTGSLGGFDVFQSVFDPAAQQWSAPQNLGAPVNSPGDDAFFRLSADGRTAFFSSDRLDDNFGERDLYTVYFKEELAAQNPANVRGNFADGAPATAPAADENGAPGIESARFAPLFYNNDRDVASADNLKIVETVAAFARRYPGAFVLVTAHTDQTGPAKFDLYSGIKRAETIGKALTDRGVPAAQILLRSAGPGYPIARNVLDAVPNPQGQRLNRRIELTLTSGEELPLDVQVERPPVSELMAAEGTARLDALTDGLSYKVEVAATRQILTNDALLMFDDLLIESQPGSGTYRYTAGWFEQYKDAQRLRLELKNQGFAEASVVAYVNGVRISRAEAVGLVKKYPDLVAYVRS